jgi:hypothetical protein
MALLAAQATVGIARGLPGLVVAITQALLGVVFLDPGDNVLGVHGDGVAERHVGRQFPAQGRDGAVEQELERGVGQVAQHAAEVLGRGQAGGHVEAPGVGGRGDEREAQEPDQRRVFDQVLAQVGHVALAFFELDQVGRHEGGAGRRRGAGPGAVGRPFGEVFPVQVGQQLAVLLGHGAVAHEAGQVGVGLGQAAEIRPREWHRGFWGRGQARGVGRRAGEEVCGEQPAGQPEAQMVGQVAGVGEQGEHGEWLLGRAAGTVSTPALYR